MLFIIGNGTNISNFALVTVFVIKPVVVFLEGIKGIYSFQFAGCSGAADGDFDVAVQALPELGQVADDLPRVHIGCDADGHHLDGFLRGRVNDFFNRHVGPEIHHPGFRQRGD